MPVLSDELFLMAPEVVSDTPSLNGGYRSYTEIPQSAEENLFNHIFTSQRELGDCQVRFAYVCNFNPSRVPAKGMRAWIHNETDADDYVYQIVMPQGAKETDITGTEDIYTVGLLKNDLAVGATSLTVTVPSTADSDTYSRDLRTAFRNGEKIIISEKDRPDSSTGVALVVTINSEPTLATDEATFSFTPAATSAFTAANGVTVSSFPEEAEIVASLGTINVTSSAGTVDENYLLLDNPSTIEDTFTFTFTSATTFTCSGVRSGNLVSGSTLSTYTPPNPAKNNEPLMNIEPGFWGGTFAIGDQVEIPTKDSSFNCAFIRVTPAGSDPFSTNRCTVAVRCESV